MRLVTASQITAWANSAQRDCQSNLPLLVSRLVRANATGIERLDFPSGDGVSDEGWDGRLSCASGDPHFPSGGSGWEIGTDKSATKKGTSDYRKRSEDPLDLDRASTTFVFVTPRPWPARHKWQQLRIAENIWRGVRVVAARELEAWLEDAPIVALWLARHLGHAPSGGLIGLEQWWDEWSAATDPVMTSGMLTAGRAAEAEAVADWLRGGGAKMEVQADSPDEALAFLAGAGGADPGGKDVLSSRCVVASSEEAFRTAANWTNPAIIAAHADLTHAAAGLAMRNGHRLFVASARSARAGHAVPMPLPRSNRPSLEAALLDSGLLREEVAEILVACGRSVTVLHRRRARLHSARRPRWAEREQGRELVAALMAGAWTEEQRPAEPTFAGIAATQLLDRQVLSDLARGADYDFITDRLSALPRDDVPVQRVGVTWRLTAPIDAWLLL